MATLENIQGGSLVADPSQALNLLLQSFGTKGQREAKAEQQRLTGVLADPGSAQERQSALIQLTSMNAPLGQAVQGILESGDKRQARALLLQAEKGARNALDVKGAKTFDGKKFKLNEWRKRIAIEPDSPDKAKRMQRVTDLINLKTEDQLNVEIQRIENAAKSIDVVLADQKAAVQAEKEQGARDANAILALPPEQQVPALAALMQKAQSEGDTEEVNALRQLIQTPFAQRQTVLQDAANQVPAAKPVSLAAGSRLVSPTGQTVVEAEQKPAKPTVTFTTLFDAEGNITGQQNDLTKEVKSDPRSIKDATLIQTLKSIGVDPKTPEGAALVKKILTTAKTKVDINRNEPPFKLEPGTQLVDPNDYTLGVEPVKGGTKDTLAGEAAAKARSLKNARAASKQIPSLIFDKDGSLNRANLATAALNIPGTQGALYNILMEQGIQAITRTETGAAMQPSELENTKERFKPAFFDSEEIGRAKFDLYNSYLDGTLKMLDPTGRLDEERFQTELDKRIAGGGKAGGGQAAPVAPVGDVDTGQKTPEGFVIFKRPDGSTYAVAP